MRAVWLVAVVLAGCASPPPDPAPPAAPELPRFTTTTTPAPSRTERTVPRACVHVITEADLDELLETRLSGSATEIAGVPVPAIGRTARLDCYFGIPAGDRAKAALVVTLAAYTTPAAAQQRVDRTLADERGQGAAVTAVAVGPDPGHLVEGVSRMVVVRHGRVTAVVEAAPALVPGDQTRRVLPLIADRALAGPANRP